MRPSLLRRKKSPRRLAAEDRFERLLWTLDATAEKERRRRTIGCVSSMPREGVSTITSRLGRTAAAAGRRVLLVDANLSQTSRNGSFAVAPGPGIADVLCGRAQWEATIQHVVSHSDRLCVLSAGTEELRNEAVGGPELESLIGELSARFDHVIFDLGSVSGNSAATRIAGCLEATLLVVEAERVRRETVERTVTLLDRAGGAPVGMVFNKRRFHLPSWLHKRL